MDSHLLSQESCIHRQSFAECPTAWLGSLFQWSNLIGTGELRRAVLSELGCGITSAQNHLGPVLQ